jgi:transcriptional regulator of arginine metabolism
VLPVAVSAPFPAPAAPDVPAAGEGGLERTVREFVLSVEAAASLVVLRTPPADASPVARALDEARLPEIVGTICGDDTIFLATRSGAAAGRLARRLESLIAPDAKSRAASRSAQPRRSKRS